MLLISQYMEHEKLFRNVNCKKSVWELITASMATENPNFSARPEQVEGKWKSLTLAFRKCCDHNIFREMTEKNAHFTGKLQRPMVTGLMFARMRQTAALTNSSSGRADYVCSHTESQEEKLEETEEEDKNEEELTVVLQTTATSQGMSRISGVIVRLANEKLTLRLGRF